MKPLTIDIGKNLTRDSIIALVGGLSLGVVGYFTQSTLLGTLSSWLAPIGGLWINALQMTVLPLVIVLMLSAVSGASGGKQLGRLGPRAVVTIVGLLIVSGVFAWILAPPLLAFFAIAPETVAAIQSQTVIPDVAAARASAPPVSFGAWLSGLISPNLIAAATDNQLLPLLIFSIMLAMAISQLPDEHREPLRTLIDAMTHAMLKLIGWILVVTPLGIFIISLGLGMSAGSDVVGLLGTYLLFTCIIRTLYILAQYPLASVFGGTSIVKFARAVANPQLVAMSTRSSIASLPAMVKSGQEKLGFKASATGFVLPLCVSSMKASSPVSSMAKLFFLGHMYGIELGFGAITIFLITRILLSFTTLGIPATGGTFRMLPAYVAAGVPLEGYIILGAVRSFTDVFATVLNVTGNMTAATIVSRGDRHPVPTRVRGGLVPEPAVLVGSEPSV